VDLKLGDIDNNGSLDIATANANSGSVSVLRSLGNGQFDISANSGFTALSLALADLNDDNLLDISVGGPANNFTVLRQQIATGLFAPQTVAVTSGNHKAIVAADFNLDGGGRPEIVLTCRAAGTFVGLQLFTNTSSAGSVSFVGPQNLSQTSTDDSGAVVVGNFNQDAGGILDMATLVFSNSNSRLEVFLGSVSGTFNSSTSVAVDLGAIPPLTRPNLLASADLDGDGFPEIVAANAKLQAISLFLNQGTGQFGTPQTLLLGFTPSAVSLFDITSDGVFDLLVTGNDQLHVFPGFGDATFGSEVVFDTGTGSQAIGVGDFNEDGLLDVVTADTAANALSLFFQDP
jgi:hypothetical protein